MTQVDTWGVWTSDVTYVTNAVAKYDFANGSFAFIPDDYQGDKLFFLMKPFERESGNAVSGVSSPVYAPTYTKVSTGGAASAAALVKNMNDDNVITYPAVDIK